MKARMPTVFVGHGSPMNALEANTHTNAWRRLGEAIPRPRAILAISAHWYTHGVSVTSTSQPRTIHDFHGFPAELFAQRYQAPGDPALAARVQELLQPVAVEQSHEWGLDHGAWSVLTHVYPRADIPVIQLSVDATRSPVEHYELGARLAPLRDEAVLIVGSGNVVHNLRRVDWDAQAGPWSWASGFNDAIRDAIARGDHAAVIDYGRMGEAATLSVPTAEHYLPLLYALGAGGRKSQVSFPTDGIELASISMLTVLCS